MLRRFAAGLLALVCLALGGCGSRLLDDFDDRYHQDMSNYESAILSEDPAHRILVNKQHPLRESHAPTALTTLPAELCNGKTVQLEATAALAAEALVRELHACGFSDIVVTSGYRTYAYQQSLFYTYMEQEQAIHPEWSVSDCEAAVLTYSARPGTSEHQTGLCMDLVNRGYGRLDETFADEPAYAFLLERAHAFGFILRYPEGKERVTGYCYEPWHFRFVGAAAATEIHERGLTLEEFTESE